MLADKILYHWACGLEISDIAILLNIDEITAWQAIRGHNKHII